ASLAASCARTEGPGTIRFWAMGNEAAQTPALLSSFERENPALHVNVQALPWTAAHERLLTAYAGHALPDVAQIGNTWLSELTAIGALLPLAANENDLLADNFPGVLETNRIRDRYYGLPWYVDTRLLFYRTDLLARAGYERMPQDWETWKTAMH